MDEPVEPLCVYLPGNREFGSMLHRLTAVLAMSVALLGIASPVLACAVTTALDENCCPPEAPSPCSNGEVEYDFATTAAYCCVAAPAPSQAVSVDAGRSVPERKLDSGSPDALALPIWMACSTVPNPPDVITPHVSASRTDAAQTYLRTGRLRL